MTPKSAASTEPRQRRDQPGDRPDPRLLELLVCPVTHTNLHYDEAAGELVSKAAGLAFPIRDSIPIMLMSEARQIEPE